MVHISGPKELFSSNFGPYLGVAWNGSLNYLLTSLFLFYSVLKSQVYNVGTIEACLVPVCYIESIGIHAKRG